MKKPTPYVLTPSDREVCKKFGTTPEAFAAFKDMEATKAYLQAGGDGLTAEERDLARKFGNDPITVSLTKFKNRPVSPPTPSTSPTMREFQRDVKGTPSPWPTTAMQSQERQRHIGVAGAQSSESESEQTLAFGSSISFHASTRSGLPPLRDIHDKSIDAFKEHLEAVKPPNADPYDDLTEAEIKACQKMNVDAREYAEWKRKPAPGTNPYKA